MTPVYDIIVRVSKVGYRQETLRSDAEQERLCRNHIAMIGGAVGVVHREVDVSGKTTDRKALNAAKDRVLEGVAHGLVVAYVSRFSRNTIEGLQLVQKILDAGREFIALDLSGMDLRSPAGRQFLTMQLAQAEAERAVRGAELDRSREQSIARGVHPHECFGYRKGRNGVLAPDPVEAQWVPRIYERRAAGSSWSALADWLNAEGVKLHHFSDRKDGRPTSRKCATYWRPKGVKALVESRTYLGEAYSGEFSNPTAHEPLVSLDLWKRCEALRDLRPRRGAAEFELAGLIRCAECGGRMVGSSYTPTKRYLKDGRVHERTQTLYRYYRCPPDGPCTIGRRVRADVLEPAVEEVFGGMTDGLRGYFAERTGTLDAGIAHLRDMEALRDEVAADLDLMRANRAAYMAALAEAERRVSSARSEVSITRQQVTGISITDEDRENWHLLPVDARRRYLAEAFEAIYVSGDRTGWSPLGRGELADPERVRGCFLTLA